MAQDHRKQDPSLIHKETGLMKKFRREYHRAYLENIIEGYNRI